MRCQRDTHTHSETQQGHNEGRSDIYVYFRVRYLCVSCHFPHACLVSHTYTNTHTHTLFVFLSVYTKTSSYCTYARASRWHALSFSLFLHADTHIHIYTQRTQRNNPIQTRENPERDFIHQQRLVRLMYHVQQFLPHRVYPFLSHLSSRNTHTAAPLSPHARRAFFSKRT